MPEMRGRVHQKDIAMFGYVTLSAKNADKAMRDEYKAYYCGLCHVLNERFGAKGTSSLSFDMVFLEMLLSDLFNDKKTEGKETCKVRPFKPHRYITTESSSYAADMQMLLYYYSLLDNLQDENKDKSKIEKLRESVSELEMEYPRQSEAIKKSLSAIHDKEVVDSREPEQLSMLFGRLLGEIFVKDETSHFAEDLRALGCALGRFIYLLDGWDDRRKDRRRGNFNPYPETITEKEAEAMLLNAAASASEAFERLPLDECVPILRNIIYSGIWTKFRRENKQ